MHLKRNHPKQWEAYEKEVTKNAAEVATRNQEKQEEDEMGVSTDSVHS